MVAKLWVRVYLEATRDTRSRRSRFFFYSFRCKKCKKRSVTYARLFRYIVQLNDVSSYRVINKSVIYLAFHVYVLRRVTCTIKFSDLNYNC